MTEHEHWMEFALKEAQRALEEDEVPVGAVVVWEGRIIGRGHNQIERLQDPTAHAEMIAITAAAAHLQSRRLEKCTFYVTLEPCAMCAGAIVLARVGRVVFGAWDDKAGMAGSVHDLLRNPKLNHSPEVKGGVRAEECGAVLKAFFEGRR